MTEVRRSYVHQVCGRTTTMSVAMAESFARAPPSHETAYCAYCRKRYPAGEFRWLGSQEKVG